MTVFVKQYGLERTGTNAVRVLLEQYLPGVRVLMHVLGDKHSPPVDLAAVAGSTADLVDPALEFVTRSTLQAPALTTCLEDRRQADYIASIANEVYEEVLGGRLRVVLSVREPYAWTRAMLEWHRRFLPPSRTIPERAAEPAIVESLCDRYNRSNRAWLRLIEQLTKNNRGAAIVRHHEIEGDLDSLLLRLARTLNLPPAPDGGARLPRTLGEAIWDQDPTPRYPEHDVNRRQRAAQLAPLPRHTVEIVHRRIDWSLVGRLACVC